jgi:hypothetical protein
MRYTAIIAVLLVLTLALMSGCSAEEPIKMKKMSLEQATEQIAGGTWESADDTGDALNFRPNGTGQSYLAETGVTAEINWRMSVDDGRLMLTWGYIETRPEDEKVWVVELNGDTMHVWPLSGSRILRDPETDDPFVLQRFE